MVQTVKKFKDVTDSTQNSNEDNPDTIKRSSKPIELYIELLIVTDRSVFQDHKRFAHTDDDNVAFIHMRTYFSHFANGVRKHHL